MCCPGGVGACFLAGLLTMTTPRSASSAVSAHDDSRTAVAAGALSALSPRAAPGAWPGAAAAAGIPARWLWTAIGVLALGVVGLGTALALQAPPVRTSNLQPTTDLAPSAQALQPLAAVGAVADPRDLPGNSAARTAQTGAAGAAGATGAAAGAGAAGTLGAGSLLAAGPAGAAPQAIPVRAPVAVCGSCGRVESVQAVQQAAPATGVGAVAGGVLGAVVGNQIGRGNGRTVATVLGAAGGGYVGHRIEQNTRTQTVYQMRVRMEDGSLRRFTRAQPVAEGTPVRVQGQGFRVDDGRHGPARPEQQPAPQPMQVVDSRY
jgi:outer membrane lipoprotein SlyB